MEEMQSWNVGDSRSKRGQLEVITGSERKQPEMKGGQPVAQGIGLWVLKGLDPALDLTYFLSPLRDKTLSLSLCLRQLRRTGEVSAKHSTPVCLSDITCPCYVYSFGQGRHQARALSWSLV